MNEENRRKVETRKRIAGGASIALLIALAAVTNLWALDEYETAGKVAAGVTVILAIAVAALYLDRLNLIGDIRGLNRQVDQYQDALADGGKAHRATRADLEKAQIGLATNRLRELIAGLHAVDPAAKDEVVTSRSLHEYGVKHTSWYDLAAAVGLVTTLHAAEEDYDNLADSNRARPQLASAHQAWEAGRGRGDLAAMLDGLVAIWNAWLYVTRTSSRAMLLKEFELGPDAVQRWLQEIYARHVQALIAEIPTNPAALSAVRTLRQRTQVSNDGVPGDLVNPGITWTRPTGYNALIDAYCDGLPYITEFDVLPPELIRRIEFAAVPQLVLVAGSRGQAKIIHAYIVADPELAALVEPDVREGIAFLASTGNRPESVKEWVKPGSRAQRQLTLQANAAFARLVTLPAADD